MDIPKEADPTSLSGATSEQSQRAEQEVLRNELARVDMLYGICVRDYFATFGVYATATSIMLASLGFVFTKGGSTVLIMTIAIAGLFLTIQWHISTTSMRDQYRHFYYRMVRLENQLGLNVMLRWHDVANSARHRTVLYSSSINSKDAAYVSWSFRQIGKPWGMRAAALPVLYSALFLAIGLSLSVLQRIKYGDLISSGIALIWLLVGTLLIYWEQKRASTGAGSKFTSSDRNVQASRAGAS
jgi:hypothetical protein